MPNPNTLDSTPRRRALVIEDDPILVAKVTRLLRRAGLEPESVPTAGVALDHLKDGEHDVVVVDLSLALDDTRAAVALGALPSALGERPMDDGGTGPEVTDLLSFLHRAESPLESPLRRSRPEPCGARRESAPAARRRSRLRLAHAAHPAQPVTQPPPEPRKRHDR